MKHVCTILCIVFASSLLSGCGNGAPKLVRMSVTPSVATAASSTKEQVRFSALGTFDNNTTRTLTTADGIQWSSGDLRVAIIDTDGMATCLGPGSAVITATAPTSPAKIVSSSGSGTTSAVVLIGGTGVQGTPTVSGSGMLSCS